MRAIDAYIKKEGAEIVIVSFRPNDGLRKRYFNDLTVNKRS
jgi:hypothetical protein